MLSILARFGPQQILISICGNDLIHMIIRGNLKSVVNFALAIKNRSGIERQMIDWLPIGRIIEIS
jgi:hypothetical protein